MPDANGTGIHAAAPSSPPGPVQHPVGVDDGLGLQTGRQWEGRPIGGKRTVAAPVSNPPLRRRVACGSRLLLEAVRLEECAVFTCQVRVDDKNGGCLLGDQLQADRTAGRSSLWQARLAPGAIMARNCVGRGIRWE